MVPVSISCESREILTMLLFLYTQQHLFVNMHVSMYDGFFMTMEAQDIKCYSTERSKIDLDLAHFKLPGCKPQHPILFS